MTLPQITATGQLGSDPEISFTPTGVAKATLSVACNENRRKDDGTWEKVSTTWLRVELWRDPAQAAADFLKKGDGVIVTGNLTVREYDRNDGTKGKSVEVKNATVAKTPPRMQQGQQPPPQQQSADPWSTAPASTTHEQPPF